MSGLDPLNAAHKLLPSVYEETCADCDGLGWHYDFGSNVSLARIVASVRGERAA